MKLSDYLIFTIIIFIFFCGCSSGNKSVTTTKELTGISVIVGNDPFTHNAILVYPDKTYLVDGAKPVLDFLSGNQGKYITVKYEEITDSTGVKIIRALEAKSL